MRSLRDIRIRKGIAASSFLVFFFFFFFIFFSVFFFFPEANEIINASKSRQKLRFDFVSSRIEEQRVDPILLGGYFVAS